MSGNNFEDLSSFTSQKEYKTAKSIKKEKNKYWTIPVLIVGILLIMVGTVCIWGSQVTKTIPSGHPMSDLQMAFDITFDKE